MARRPIALLVACGLCSLALVVAISVPTDLAAASKTTKAAAKKPIRNPKFDPTAEQVDLFDAVDAGQVSVKLVPKDAMGGNIFVENKTDKPLTIKFPEAVVGISINAQFGGMGGGMGGMGGMGGGMGGMGGGMGGGQMMGGGMGGGMMGGMGGGMGGMGGGMGGMGGGFFSIPPEKVVQIPMNSVCLEHGKPEPHSGNKYTLIPFSRVSKDPVLYKLLSKVASGKVDAQAAQAAAWNLANNMSFQELAAKTDNPGSPTANSYFTQEQLFVAQSLIADAKELAADFKLDEKNDDTKADPKSNATKTARVTKK